MNDTRRIGTDGENQACMYLSDKGYRIIQRNYRIRAAEIDIIAEIDTILCFVEVKKRKNTDFGEPFESVKLRKQHKILTAADHFLLHHQEYYSQHDVRFDIIGISDRGIEHIEGAFDDTRE